MDKNTEKELENNQNAAAEYADRVSDGIMGVMGSEEEGQKEESQPEQKKEE